MCTPPKIFQFCLLVFKNTFDIDKKLVCTCCCERKREREREKEKENKPNQRGGRKYNSPKHQSNELELLNLSLLKISMRKYIKIRLIFERTKVKFQGSMQDHR
jgi:hypothetical protein